MLGFFGQFLVDFLRLGLAEADIERMLPFAGEREAADDEGERGDAGVSGEQDAEARFQRATEDEPRDVDHEIPDTTQKSPERRQPIHQPVQCGPP